MGFNPLDPVSWFNGNRDKGGGNVEGPSNDPLNKPGMPGQKPGIDWTNLILGGIEIGLDYYGDKKNRESQEAANLANIAYQQQFAKEGIRWRVEDAKAAGLHPLAALGAAGAQFSPSSQSVMSGDMYKNMGQNISRAAKAMMSGPERRSIEAENYLRLERMGLENELLRQRVQATTVGNVNSPPMPVSQMTEETLYPGEYTLAPSMETAMASQGDYSMPLIYGIKNRLAPWMYNWLVPKRWEVKPDPKVYPPPKGYNDWEMNTWGRWIPVYRGKKQ